VAEYSLSFLRFQRKLKYEPRFIPNLESFGRQAVSVSFKKVLGAANTAIVAIRFIKLNDSGDVTASIKITAHWLLLPPW